MSILTDFLTTVADAIRTKKHTVDDIPAQSFAAEILSIPEAVPSVLVPLEVLANGIYIPGEGCDGFNQVNVNVASGAITDGIVVNERDANGKYVDITIYGSVLANQFENYTTLTRVTIASGTAIGAEAFQGCTKLAELVLPNTLKTISEYAFKGCTSLTSVTIPASVTSIGTYAFSGCTNLATVNWNAASCTCTSYPPFDSCNKITAINIADGITSIPAYAFQNKNGSVSTSVVTVMEIPETVTTIGAYAFNKRGFEVVTVPSAVTSIGTYAFANCSNLKTVNWNPSSCSNNTSYPPFDNCNNIVEINFADDLTAVPAYTFYNKNGSVSASVITSVVIPESVKTIGAYAFNKRGIDTITIPSAVTSIGAYAFSGCTNLVTLYWNAVSCGNCSDDAPFNNCTKIANIYIADDVKRIPDYAFRAGSGSNTALTSVEIPESVTYIGYGAFTRFKALTSVTIPRNVADIGRYAFSECVAMTTINWNAVSCAALDSYAIFGACSSLEAINIAEDVTKIPAYAFYNKSANNTTVTSVFVPNSVKSIGTYAFAKMTALASVQIGDSAECAITTIDTKAFNSDTALTDITIYAAEGGVTGSPWGATNATITWACYNAYSCAVLESGTDLATSVQCKVGDLVIASIITRDTLSLSDGWTLISTSDLNSADTVNQRLSFAYKYAESTNENITVTQASAQRMYINLVAITGATGFVDNGYQYKNTADNETITVNRPESDGFILWAASAPIWGTGTWKNSIGAQMVQLSASARLCNVLDETLGASGDTVTFTGNGTSTMTVGSLTIEGITGFDTKAWI